MLTLSELTDHCAQETERFFQGQSYDPQFCFELFRRAILEHDQLAWEAIHVQYYSLVTGWVNKHRGFETSGEEAQYFVNRAFEKIWAALTPDRFGRFSDLRALLGYLKMCVNSVIVDHTRSLVQANLYIAAEESTIEARAHSPALEDGALDRLYRQTLWESMDTRLHDEKERLVVYGSFILGLKPRELYDRFQNTFSGVDEVYHVKQNILARLRRDADFQRLLEERD